MSWYIFLLGDLKYTIPSKLKIFKFPFNYKLYPESHIHIFIHLLVQMPSWMCFLNFIIDEVSSLTDIFRSITLPGIRIWALKIMFSYFLSLLTFNFSNVFIHSLTRHLLCALPSIKHHRKNKSQIMPWMNFESGFLLQSLTFPNYYNNLGPITFYQNCFLQLSHLIPSTNLILLHYYKLQSTLPLRCLPKIGLW